MKYNRSIEYTFSSSIVSGTKSQISLGWIDHLDWMSPATIPLKNIKVSIRNTRNIRIPIRIVPPILYENKV